jgi:hypothetical protein
LIVCIVKKGAIAFLDSQLLGEVGNLAILFFSHSQKRSM